VLPPPFTLVSCVAYSSTLKMKATCFPETSVDFQRTTRRYIPEDRTLCTEEFLVSTVDPNTGCPKELWLLGYNANRRFRGTCRLNLQCRKISQARNQREAGSKHRISKRRVFIVPLKSRDSAVGIATGWTTEKSEFESR
jgi:hypothetical protein